ncbi:MAG: hypothetical protein HYZ13_15465 [Acidobacteria bacterium]|nr:hypothetical protein [Acidobacteriota bacterium]
MSQPWMLAALGLGLLVVGWVAFKLGQILIRILVGLAALGLISWGIWRLLK